MTNTPHPRRLSQQERLLLGILRAGNFRRLPAWKRTKYEFLLEHGWRYRPSRLPKHIKRGEKNECFNNAFELALNDHSLTYCEGFVLNRTGKLPIHHAWVTDGTGRAIDNTLVESASAYFGVPFNTAFLCRYYLKTKDITSMLDDYEHHWPLLRRLGDKPEKWLEPKGCGLARLT
jgi:hypothetical protein